MSTSYAQTKRIENLHLTRERDRRRGRELATFLLAGLPVACALLGYAALHIETVRVGYLREARQKTMAQLTEENRRLRAELGRASSPERVAALAKNKGLRAPHPGQVQYVEPTGLPPAPTSIEEKR
jgi:cell division protein FtsB